MSDLITPAVMDQGPRQAPAGPGKPRSPAPAYPQPHDTRAAAPSPPKRSHTSTEYPVKLHFSASLQAGNSLARLCRRRGFHLREVDHLRFALDLYLRTNDPQYVRECDGSQ
jgi:hypothetical protein